MLERGHVEDEVVSHIGGTEPFRGSAGPIDLDRFDIRAIGRSAHRFGISGVSVNPPTTDAVIRQLGRMDIRGVLA
jgi:hypothetical protein